MKFKAADKCFQLDGKDIFLYSGEIHYFRIPREKWALHLDKLKEAGCNAMSTYIPWSWHEHDEGKYDFTGKTDPQRDLIGLLNLCKEKNLLVSVKPGPFILAEYAGGGIPEWFFSKYPETHIRNIQGEIASYEAFTLLHPTYLRYACKWFDQVCPIISDNQISKGGPIVLHQICNEVGMFTWLIKQADYSDSAMNYYRKFLAEKYKDIKKLNQIHGKGYDSFEEVKAHIGNIESYNDVAIDIEWHDFWRWYYALYLEYLMNEIRKRGVNLQFYHNLPGWVYGQAMEFPINISMYSEVSNMLYPDVVLGSDLIPENVTYRNFYDDMPCNYMAWAMQGHKGPIYSPECQCGSREHCVTIYPNELDVFYKACLAHGLVAINLYMFSQGKNPHRMGYFGPMFYYQTALDYLGNEDEMFPVVKKLGRYIKTHGDNLIKTDKKSDICVLWYKPYYATEATPDADYRESGLTYEPRKLRNHLYFYGMIKVLQMLNQDFDICDLQLVEQERLAKYKQVWLFSLDFLDGESQQKLVDYTHNGGRLVVLPTLPSRDLNMHECNIMQKEFAIEKTDTVQLVPSRIDFMGLESIHTYFGVPMNIYDPKDCEQVIAKLADGRCCGVIKKYGKGKATLLGTGFEYGIEEHITGFKKFVELDNIEPVASSDNSGLAFSERFAEDFGYLFVCNMHSIEKSGTIYYTHPKTGKKMTIPYKGGKITVPAKYAFISPLNVKIDGSDEKIVHSTSEILEMSVAQKVVSLIILGAPEVAGETVLELKTQPSKVTLDGKALEFEYTDGKVIIAYNHEREKEMQLQVHE